MDGCFSQEVKSLIAESRLIAIELGYDYISTVHLFLADCKLNDQYSIRSFVFESQEDYETFFKSQRVGESTILADNLPSTMEAAKTIRKAFKLWNHSNYFDTEIRPYHLFLAASLLPKSLFYSIFQSQEGLHEKLEQYYIGIGQINRDKIYKSLWMRLSKKLFN